VTTLLLLLVCIVASALFAGLETGFVSLNRVRLRVQAGRGDGSARVLLRLLEKPELTLSSFLIGNTLSNVGGGALATAWASQRLGEAGGSLFATVGMTCVFLVFSEVVPKTYFRMHADEVLPRFLWFVRLTGILFAPLVWVAAGVFRILGGGKAGNPFVTREELRQLVREAGGRLGLDQRRMLENIFDFGHTVVREVMIPLPEVVSLPETAAPQALFDTVRGRGYTRVPVYRSRVDRITGVVNVFDMLYEESPTGTLADHLRPLHIVPETQDIPRVMVELQRRREAMALVVNEFGACMGIVTLEDIVEEILGELADEHEDVSLPIQRTSDGYLLDASVDIDDLNEELSLSLEKDQFETVAGLLLKHTGRIPKVGERIRVGRLEFEVLAVHQYGLRRLKLRMLQAQKEGAGDDG